MWRLKQIQNQTVIWGSEQIQRLLSRSIWLMNRLMRFKTSQSKFQNAVSCACISGMLPTTQPPDTGIGNFLSIDTGKTSNGILFPLFASSVRNLQAGIRSSAMRAVSYFVILLRHPSSNISTLLRLSFFFSHKSQCWVGHQLPTYAPWKPLQLSILLFWSLFLMKSISVPVVLE